MESLRTAREGGQTHWDRSVVLALWFVLFALSIPSIVLIML